MHPISLSHVEVSSHWAICQRWTPGFSLRTRFLDAEMMYALWLILDGGVEITLHGRTWYLAPGQVFLCPMAAERVICSPHGAEWLSVGLRAALFSKIDLFQDIAPPTVSTPSAEERTALEGWMRQLIRYAQAPQASNQLIIQGLTMLVAGCCCRMWDISSTTLLGHRDLPDWLERVIRAIQDTPGISVAALAGMARFSEPHFRRLFTQWTGYSPHTFLQRHRLELAKYLLDTADLPVALIADHLGFASHAHFSRLFHKAYGLSPQQYRLSVVRVQV
jgi:AraC-like DNA-binding protein